MVLLKIIPGRPQDLADAEKIIMRHKGRLDIGYLKNWAQEISAEAQNPRIAGDLDRLLTVKY